MKKLIILFILFVWALSVNAGTIRIDGKPKLTEAEVTVDTQLTTPMIFLTKYFWQDDFDYEAGGVQFESGLNADFYVTAGTNYAAAKVTYTAGISGELAAITDGLDNDSVTIIGVGNFRINSNPILEARIKVSAITTAYFAVGFAEGSYADKATHDDDIFVVGMDTDNAHTFGVAQIIAVSNDNNAGAVTMDMGTAVVAGAYVKIKIDLANTEQPKVWINDSIVAAGSVTGTVQAGITISPYIMIQSLSGAADTMTVDYIRAWQDR